MITLKLQLFLQAVMLQKPSKIGSMDKAEECHISYFAERACMCVHTHERIYSTLAWGLLAKSLFVILRRACDLRTM